MKHVFKATKLGWEKEKEGIWFDSEIRNHSIWAFYYRFRKNKQGFLCPTY